MLASNELTQQLHPRVLIVDDDPEFLRVFTRQVAGMGYVVDGAEDYGQSLALASANNYDVALIDLRMQVNGIELMDQIAQRSLHTSFILVTGAGDVRDEDTRSVGRRLTGVLLKPINEADLESALAQAFAAAHHYDPSALPEPPVRVLLVEDSQTDAVLLRHVLMSAGNYEITHATRLKDAVQLLHEQSFDTVITDLSLPDALGVGAVVRLRQCAPDVALIVHSATSDDELALRAVELGAQDFIVKGGGGERVARALRLARVRRRAERRLVRMAHTDPLTGLSNRTAFAEALDRGIAHAKRTNSCLGVMYVDLDGFKAVNDRYGHETGDELLKEVARRMRSCTSEEDVVARLGGDEFAVLVPDLAASAFDALVGRIADTIGQQLRVGEAQLSVRASIGVARFPENVGSGAHLLRLADQAMYGAKRSRASAQ